MIIGMKCLQSCCQKRSWKLADFVDVWNHCKFHLLHFLCLDKEQRGNFMDGVFTMMLGGIA